MVGRLSNGFLPKSTISEPNNYDMKFKLNHKSPLLSLLFLNSMLFSMP